MFLSVVSNISNPASSAAVTKSPFLSLSRPSCAAVRTAWPSRYRWIGRRVNGHFVETARGKLDNRLDLFAVQPVEPLHDVVYIGPGFQILEDGGFRDPRVFQNPSAANLAGDALHGGAL